MKLRVFAMAIACLHVLAGCAAPGNASPVVGSSSEAAAPPEETASGFFTVPAMTEKQQACYDVYIEPIFYSGLLMRNWSPGEAGELMDDPSGASNGNCMMLAFEDIKGEEMQALWKSYEGRFPAEMVEEVLLARFSFPAEQLREILSYHYRPDEGVYYYEGGRGGGPIEGAVTGFHAEGDLLILNYVSCSGFSGLDEEPMSYFYQMSGRLTLKKGADGGFRYWSVEVGEEREAPVPGF